MHIYMYIYTCMYIHIYSHLSTVSGKPRPQHTTPITLKLLNLANSKRRTLQRTTRASYGACRATHQPTPAIPA